MDLDALKVARLTGIEPFHAAGNGLGFDMLSFWQWSCSDICGNALRGVIAEYLVAQALGAANGVRTEWDAYDVVTHDGLKVEVKNSAYLQTWKQTKLSPVKFDIAPKQGGDVAQDTIAGTEARFADVYVFTVYAHKDKATINPLDVSHWDFYILPTTVLDERVPKQNSIVLSSLLKLGPTKVGFEGLRAVIESATSQRHPG